LGYILYLPHAIRIVSNLSLQTVLSKTHIIKSPRIPLRSINPNPRTPRHKEIPLITRSMPMDLPQRPRLHRHHRGTKLTRNWEDCRIDDLYRSAGCFVIVSFLREVVGIGLCDWQETCTADHVLGRDVSGGFRAGEDEQFARWDVVPG
jgi:hypothetical protein